MIAALSSAKTAQPGGPIHLWEDILPSQKQPSLAPACTTLAARSSQAQVLKGRVSRMEGTLAELRGEVAVTPSRSPLTPFTEVEEWVFFQRMVKVGKLQD